MSIAHRQITIEEFERMAFDVPMELVCGELAEQGMPSLQHGTVCAAITMFLTLWARTGKHGLVFSHDSFVKTDADTVRGPDCGFIRWNRLPGSKPPLDRTLKVPADLVVEVLSPTDRWTNVLDKVIEYLRSGVTEVWVIDPDQRSVTVHRAESAPLHFEGDVELTRPELLPGFICRVSDLFADIAS